MNTRIRLAIAAVAVLLYGSLSCTEDPTRIGRPPVVQGFSPDDQVLDAFTGDTLVFSVWAMDPDRSMLHQRFSVDDSVVAGGTPWRYVVEDTGVAIVSCVVTDGEYDSRIQWVINRHLRINHPPEIYSFSPVEPNPTMIIGTDLEFAVDARDEDGDPLDYLFTVDGEEVASADRFVFTATEEGARAVEAIVSDGELSSVRHWNLLVTGIPDTDPPAEVPIVDVSTGAEPGEIDVSWLAVGQDGFEGDASNYLVRTSPSPMLSEEDWNRASVQPGVPDALPSGELMSMTITGMIPGRYTHVAVRALDDFGNISPLGESVGVYTRGMRISGRILDAVTLAPIPGATVKLAHFGTEADMDGRFEFIELPPLDNSLGVRDELVLADPGLYYDYETDYVVQHLDYLEIFLLPDVALQTSLYEDFYQLFRDLTDTDGIPFSTQQRRWELPINVYIPQFSNNGLDYTQTVADVTTEFEQILGYPLFNLVASVPELGVQVQFVAGINADNYQTTEWTQDYYPAKGRIKFRTLYAPATVNAFKVVIRHEFGHVLGLYHSSDRNHLMVGGQTPGVSWFSADELSVIRARYHIPRGVDIRDYSVE